MPVHQLFANQLRNTWFKIVKVQLDFTISQTNNLISGHELILTFLVERISQRRKNGQS